MNYVTDSLPPGTTADRLEFDNEIAKETQQEKRNKDNTPPKLVAKLLRVCCYGQGHSSLFLCARVVLIVTIVAEHVKVCLLSIR